MGLKTLVAGDREVFCSRAGLGGPVGDAFVVEDDEDPLANFEFVVSRRPEGAAPGTTVWTAVVTNKQRDAMVGDSEDERLAERLRH